MGLNRGFTSHTVVNIVLPVSKGGGGLSVLVIIYCLGL